VHTHSDNGIVRGCRTDGEVALSPTHGPTWASLIR
jgi:hypothetical protein